MPVSTAYFTALTNKVNAIAANINADEAAICAEIQSFENEVMAELQTMITAMRAQMAALLPMTTAPTDLGSCISWITRAMAPYVAAYEQATADVTAVLSAVSSLESAITNAAGKLTACTITPTPVS
jgi:hypothetical protein